MQTRREMKFKYAILPFFSYSTVASVDDCARNGEIENEIETFCKAEEITIVLSKCIIRKYGIYPAEFYLSGATGSKFLSLYVY